MVSIGISEFTYGYAFLYEQTHANWNDLKAAPILPSLQQEQEFGWDAHLPAHATDFYYQFKLSDYLSRPNAKFISNGTYDGPYYRIGLHRKDNNRQHQRLRTHCAANPHTDYVAPQFTTVDAFNAAYLARQLSAQSRVIPVAECPDVDDSDQHYITYRPDETAWDFHSERARRARSFLGRDLDKLYRSSRVEWRQVNQQFAIDLFDKTRAIVDAMIEREGRRSVVRPMLRLLDFDPRRADRNEVLARTSQIVAVMLGVTLVLVGSDRCLEVL